MAKRRKAPSRTKSSTVSEPVAAPDEEVVVDAKDEESGSEKVETCPVCELTPRSGPEDLTWVMCEGCELWYHASCVGLSGKLETIDKWYCEGCISQDPSRVITFKAPARKSTRTTNKVDYANLNDGIAGDPRRWFRHLNQKPMKKNSFKHMQGSEVSLEWLREDDSAMTEPVIIDNPEGLGMKMPPSTFTVADVAKLVGPREKVEVLDVASQREDKGWTLQTWADYYNKPASEREKIRNVISLEISETKLADKILPPQLVRDIDWVEQMWPAAKRKPGMPFPKVQMYCLMSVAECWTDWHLDFAGSSVYYHILKGSKIFYFIRPTPANLAAYEKWSGNETYQASVWLGDWVDEVIKVELTEGNTMIIPTGWIHCVYTPKDSLVFGGNFLHSWNIATQLRIRALEITTRVPKKFRFPYFRKLCWYVAEKTVKDIKAKEDFPPRVLNGMDALARFLTKESRIIERPSSTEAARRDSKEQVPATIKDPAALAREFRWRVRLAAGHDSGDELESPFSTKANTAVNGSAASSSSKQPVSTAKGGGGAAAKRKRGEIEERSQERFKSFIPRQWDDIDTRKLEEEHKEFLQVPTIPSTTDGVNWFDVVDATDADTVMDGEPRRKAQRTRLADEVIRVRRRLGADGSVVGIEREVVRRVYEHWDFSAVDRSTSSSVEDVQVNVMVDDEEPKPVTHEDTDLPRESDAMDTTADVILDPPPGDHDSILDSSHTLHDPLDPVSSMDHESVSDMLDASGFASANTSSLVV